MARRLSHPKGFLEETRAKVICQFFGPKTIQGTPITEKARDDGVINAALEKYDPVFYTAKFQRGSDERRKHDKPLLHTRR